MARTYATTGRSAAAKSYSQRAIDTCQRVSSAQAQAEALEASGEALLYSGDALQGAVLFRQARERFAEANDDDGAALALLQLGYARFYNERREGVRLAGDAMALWDSNKNRYGVAQARTALGFFAVITGEWETGQCNYARALPALQEIGDRDNEAVALNGLGKLSLETGDAKASLANYRSARRIFASVQDPLGGGEAITGMAKALDELQRYPELLQLYSVKLQQARQAKSRAQEAAALAGMAGVYQRVRQYTRTEALYRQALEIYRSVHQPIGESDIMIGLANLKIEQGNNAQAISFLESALRLKERTTQPEAVAKIQYELAYIYRRLNRLEAARTAIEKTVEIIESQRMGIAKFDSRASCFASVHKYYALYIQVLMLLHREHPSGGFARIAFDAAEKSKVRSLLDLLTTSSQNAPCEELPVA
jgi:tetratricopeptide (TPR) repeat protein